MADKNFIVKNGLTVGGVDIISNSGVLTQSLITTVPAATNASTQSVGNSSTLIATTAYVRGEIDALIDSAPGTLNTLDELAAAINDDAQFNTTPQYDIDHVCAAFAGERVGAGGGSGTNGKYIEE